MASIKANAHFNAETACKDLQHAMHGIGTNENKLIEVLTNHNNAQRQEIKKKYKVMYGKELKDHIRSEVTGDFQEALVDLLYTPVEYDARSLNRSLHLIGSKPHALIEILTTRNNAQLKQIEAAYTEKFKSELDNDLKHDVHLSLGHTLRALASASRPEDSKVNNDEAVQDAQAMFDAGEKDQFGTHESEFIRVLCSRSYAQLRKTFEEYSKLAGKDITESIKHETSGDFEDALIAIVECVRDMPKFFAEQAHRDIHGLGTKDNALIRVIITRSEIDLETIKQKYLELYNTSLHDSIKHDTSHHYTQLLQAICKK